MMTLQTHPVKLSIGWVIDPLIESESGMELIFWWGRRHIFSQANCAFWAKVSQEMAIILHSEQSFGLLGGFFTLIWFKEIIDQKFVRKTPFF